MAKHSIKNPITRDFVFNKYNGLCAYCGSELKDRFTIDHITPLKRHIKHTPKTHLEVIDNYNPCCISCNSSKSDLSLDDWKKEINLKYSRLHRDSSAFRLLVRMGIVSDKPNKFKFYFERV